MKRTVPILATAVPLLVLTSGCGLFSTAVVDLMVVSVSVSPAVGQGPFTASVEVSPHTDDSRLQCYVTQSGQAVTLGTPVYDQAVVAAGSLTTVSFDFTPAQGGLQEVVCADAPGDKSAVTERNLDQVRSNEFSVPYEATGVRSDYASDGTTFCDVPTTVTLTLLPGGKAQMVSNGPGVNDHINCTQASGGAAVSWIADGTVASPGAAATFTSCNEGRFQGTGQVAYSDGLVKGSVTCSKDGTTWVTVKLG